VFLSLAGQGYHDYRNDHPSNGRAAGRNGMVAAPHRRKEETAEVTPLERAAAAVRRWRENPLAFVYEELKFEPDPWQEDFFRVLPSQNPKEKQVALKACTGPGKSACLAGANLWFMGCFGGLHDHPRGFIISVDEANLRSTIWAELAKWQSHSEYMKKAFTWNATKFHSNEHPATWWLEARTWAKKADKEAQGRALSGLHGPFVMMTLDEAGDIPVPILRSAQQIFSSQHRWAKVLVGGNPTSLEGVLYHVCVAEAHRTYVISITADPDSPLRAKRTDLENAREQIRLYGRNNPWVMATILGEFPPASINALLGIEDIETAMRRMPRVEQFDWAQKRLGIDCARFGDDRTTICPRQGPAWRKPVALRGVRTSVIAARIISAVNKWEPRAPHEVLILIDQTGGWGQGTVDQLIVAGYSPIDLVYSTPDPEAQYYNIRTGMHFRMAKHIRESAGIPDIAETKDLRAELTALTYTLREGKLMVEPKEFVKMKLGRSPDLADGYAQTYALPDMPRQSAQHLLGQQKARTDFDPYAEQQPVAARGRQGFDNYDDAI
jgi:hypothetical protein